MEWEKFCGCYSYLEKFWSSAVILFEVFFTESNTCLISLIFLSYETFVFDIMSTNMPYPDKRIKH